MSILRLAKTSMVSRHFSVVPRHQARKDVSGALPAKWDPGQVEAGWYDWWRDQGYFQPSPGAARKTFSMVLPPPNVTGVLHLGHALTTTIQDVVVRYHRMRGWETTWVPGTDHAGIATQVVVEKQVMASKGLTRHQLGRQGFLEEVESWQRDKGGHILGQLEQLGGSLDWSRIEFTLSPRFKTAVNAAFIQLFDRGLIYRKQQLVNWSPELKSAISDIEVDHVSVDGRTEFEVPGYHKSVTFGVMTNIAYQVMGGGGEVVVSTTRPETMLGDTAVAVHPEDKRYLHLHGRMVWHPFRGEEIPVITDTAVKPELGTGAVKITPGHDFNDWEMGERHNLRVINMLDESGHLNSECGEFAGQHRFDARESVVSALSSLGLLRGEDDHTMTVPVCGRTGDVIEPLVRPQWFVNTRDLSEMANNAVMSGDLELDPPHQTGVWHSFMGDQRDWCVSRQIWWGHQVPAYLCSSPDQTEVWVAAHSETEARKIAADKLGQEQSEISVTRDEDVLDTWFSSGIYPFAVFGWPDYNSDLSKFYPLDLMETGHDILFFWVGRMVMLGLALTGKLPFHKVLLHGVICDPEGRKMSKSLGNVIDPLHLVHGASKEQLVAGLHLAESDGCLSPEERQVAESSLLRQFPQGFPASGVDALRWGLVTHDIKSQTVSLDPRVVQGAGAWCNKVWQLARFLSLAHSRAEGRSLATLPSDFQPGLMDMWILSQLAGTVARVNQHLEERDLHHATQDLRAFVYTDLCDTYVEYVKQSLSDPAAPEFLPSLLILHSCVLTSIKLLHPFVPFITEELYQRLPKLPNERRKDSIMVDMYPQASEWNGFLNPDLGRTVELVLTVVKGVRSMKQTYELRGDVRPLVLINVEAEGVDQFGEVIQRLAKCGEIRVAEDKVDPSNLPHGFISYSSQEFNLYMDVGDHIDYEKEITKINDKLAKVEKERQKIVKAQKGKFKYRIKPEDAAEKNLQLDEIVMKLEEQLNIMEGLRKSRS